MQKAVMTSVPGAARGPTVNVPLQEPDDEAVNLAPVRTVLGRWSVTSAKGAPVTPGGSLHGVTDETVIVVPGGPEVGVARKVRVWACAGIAPQGDGAPMIRITTNTALDLRILHRPMKWVNAPPMSSSAPDAREVHVPKLTVPLADGVLIRVQPPQLITDFYGRRATATLGTLDGERPVGMA